MHELIQYLLLGETDQFTDRFQSFIDQIPKPTGAGAAPSRPGFFQGFFLGMFSSIRSINVSSTFNYNQVGQREAIDLGINVDNIKFRIDEEEVLYIGVVNNHELLRFTFSTDGSTRRIDRSNVVDISNINGQLRVSSRQAAIDPIQLRDHKELINEMVSNDLEDLIYQMSNGNEDSVQEFFIYGK
ncbi:MAG: hypothetical protein KTV77_05475 [Wolbachia endosymbiont of Fragariocoptes setiger]|nr:hypothetical protein [Wolbachia endosymbiont of Fragariocoptes setiger]